MAFETTHGTLRQTRLTNESAEYLARREELRLAEAIEQRGIDLLTPVYNLLDLTPGGRDDWYAQLTYPERAPLAAAVSRVGMSGLLHDFKEQVVQIAIGEGPAGVQPLHDQGNRLRIPAHLQLLVLMKGIEHAMHDVVRLSLERFLSQDSLSENIVSIRHDGAPPRSH